VGGLATEDEETRSHAQAAFAEPSRARAAARTVKVMRNNTRPRARRAEVCRPVASLNSLAMVEDRVEPESNRLLGKLCELPMMKVTAMVSPRARPRPSITAPMALRRT